MNRCILSLLAVGCVLCLFGCQPSVSSDRLLLVSFVEDEPITYQMTAERETEIDLTTGDPSKKSKPQFTTEKLELLMVYKPVDVNPFGLTTIEVTCKKANVTRSGFSGNKSPMDAMQGLATRSFTLKLSPTGDIVDTSDLERMVKELATQSFSGNESSRTIKNPDMIADFLALQQMLWSPVAAIPNQMNLDAGDTWQQQEAVAWPLPMYPPPSRMTTYTLDRITEEQPRKAVISSTYTISEKPLETYLKPYKEGRFQMRGLFGFLRNYQFKHIEGDGNLVFNIDDGIVESAQQQYQMNVTATFMLPLGDSLPVLTVNQKFHIKRVNR